MIRLVYLAGPIDLVDGPERHDWRIEAEKALGARGMSSYNPARAFHWVGDANGGSKVIRINRMAMEQSDAVLFRLTTKPTVGTWRELQMAIDMGKPVVGWDVTNGAAADAIYLDGMQRYSTLESAAYRLLNGDLDALKMPV